MSSFALICPYFPSWFIRPTKAMRIITLDLTYRQHIPRNTQEKGGRYDFGACLPIIPGPHAMVSPIDPREGADNEIPLSFALRHGGLQPGRVGCPWGGSCTYPGDCVEGEHSRAGACSSAVRGCCSNGGAVCCDAVLGIVFFRMMNLLSPPAPNCRRRHGCF